MQLQLFLNELSVPNEQLARAVSVIYLKQLVATVRRAHDLDSALILNSDVPLGNFPLGQGATISSIRNDGECVEESLYLKTVNNRAPFNMAVAETGGDPGIYEYKLPLDAVVRPGGVALGLGFSHLLRGLSLSLPSHNFWLERHVELDLFALDDSGNITEARILARNADCPAAIPFHTNELQALFAPSINNGIELWTRRAELLPHLVFIPRTRAQVEAILTGDPMLEQTWIKLNGINRAIEAWKIARGPYPMFPFNVRPESKTRRALCVFSDAQGYDRMFSDHCDLAPIEGRIHFIVETNPQPRALIGHIGRKLGIG